MAAETTIRPANPDDLAAVDAAFGGPETPWRKADASTLLVAYTDGEVSGAVLVHPDLSRIEPADPDLPHSPAIQALAVAPAYRRLGIGAALVRAAEELARSWNGQMLWVLAPVSTDEAVTGLADRLGYEDWGNGIRERAGTPYRLLVKIIDPELPGFDRWDAWDPRNVAGLLAGVDATWWVAGGWALDLWHGEQTRPHEDLEIAVPRERFDLVRAALDGYRLYTAGNGQVRPVGPADQPPLDRHQVWVCDPTVPAWRMDVFLDAGDADTWAFRRDPEIRGRRVDLHGRTDDGIPYLRPEVVLLHKARLLRDKDRDDFDRALPALSGQSRRWLDAALARTLPDHPWRQELTTDRS
ncbi:GNAT family N-acetyltransferase [Plantactinospora sp. GCM10030261]|uniref:GNAT family N-acetyltransferase n=1 Tax=Plantactinospora sp. GCM10030261 TaxID=3273420 RepID=UPI00361AF2BE